MIQGALRWGDVKTFLKLGLPGTGKSRDINRQAGWRILLILPTHLDLPLLKPTCSNVGLSNERRGNEIDRLPLMNH